MKAGAFLLASSILGGSALAQSPEGIFAQGTIAGVLDAWHGAAAAADEEKYFSYFTPDAVFLGSDASERWTRDEFRKWAATVLRPGQGLELQGGVAVDLLLAGPRRGMVRRGARHAEHGPVPGIGCSRPRGRLMADHPVQPLRPIPNDLVDEFTKRIGEEAKKKRKSD